MVTGCRGYSLIPTPPNTTAVWWDIDRCPVPHGYDPRCVRPSIESALMKSFGSGPVIIFAMGNIRRISRPMRKAISTSGIFVRHTESDIVRFLEVFHLWTVDNAPPARMMLISDDAQTRMFHDFISDFEILGFDFIPGGKDWLWKNLLQKEIHVETNTDDILEKMCEETGEPPWFCPICEYYSYGYRAFARHLCLSLENYFLFDYDFGFEVIYIGGLV